MAVHTVATLAALAALSPSDGDEAFVHATKARYRYDSGSSATTDQWCIIRLGTAFASQVLTASSNFGNNETVVIDGKTYTFKTTMTNTTGASYEVKIGGSLQTSLASLAAAINLGAGPGTAYGDETWTLAREHPTVRATSNATTLTVTAKDAGTGGNSLAVSETAANASWGAANLAGGAGSTGGRWIIATDKLTLPILGSSNDDWINYREAAIACAANGIWLRLGAGQYEAKTRQRFPSSGARIEMTPQTIINATITAVDNRDSPILGYATVTAADTLNSAVGLGGTAFQVVGSTTFTAGDFVIVFTDQYRGQMFRVIAWNGGSKTFTTDRPAKVPKTAPNNTDSYPLGAGVWKVTPVKDAIIHFNGARIKGACQRFVEIWGGWNCKVYGPVELGDGTATTATETLFSWDGWSYNCQDYGIIGDGADTTTLGSRFESTENCSSHDGIMRRCQFSNYLFGDALDSHCYDCASLDSAGDGVTWTAATDAGSHNCVWHGGTIAGSGSTGALFEGGSARCGITGGTSIIDNNNGVVDEKGSDNFLSAGVMVRLSAANGIYLDATSQRFTVSADTVVQDNVYGLQVINGATRPDISGKFYNNTTANFVVNGQCHFGHVTAITVSDEINLSIASTGIVTADRLDLTQSTAGSEGNIDCAGDLRIAAGTIQQAAGGEGINLTGSAVLKLGGEVRIIGHGSGGHGIVVNNSAQWQAAPGAEIEDNAITDVSTPADSIDALEVFSLTRG